MRCVILDVGQGDAIVLQFPGGRTILVDAGPSSPSYDVGERVIVPFLSRLGIARLDALILTHAHDDHAGGLRAVLRNFTVDRIFVPTIGARQLFPAGDSLKSPFIVTGTGDSLSIGGGRVYMLAPADTGAYRDANAESVVLKVTFGHTALLLTGDMPAAIERRLIPAYGDFLRADLLKVGHHGSPASSSPEFLAAVRPEFAGISVGRMNRHGHPSLIVLDRLERIGADVGRTDEDGALMYETYGDSLVRVSWQ
jgi:competence protein ComEC